MAYLKRLQSDGFRYGLFVADCKLVTGDLVRSMNGEEGSVTFLSRCPASFEKKLEERMILKDTSAL